MLKSVVDGLLLIGADEQTGLTPHTDASPEADPIPLEPVKLEDENDLVSPQKLDKKFEQSFIAHSLLTMTRNSCFLPDQDPVCPDMFPPSQFVAKDPNKLMVNYDEVKMEPNEDKLKAKLYSKMSSIFNSEKQNLNERTSATPRRSRFTEHMKKSVVASSRQTQFVNEVSKISPDFKLLLEGVKKILYPEGLYLQGSTGVHRRHFELVPLTDVLGRRSYAFGMTFLRSYRIDDELNDSDGDSDSDRDYCFLIPCSIVVFSRCFCINFFNKMFETVLHPYKTRNFYAITNRQMKKILWEISSVFTRLPLDMSLVDGDFNLTELHFNFRFMLDDNEVYQASLRPNNPEENLDFTLLSKLFSFKTIEKIFTYLLIQKRVVMLCHDRFLLSMLMELISTLFHPFKWIFPYITWLPAKLIDIIGAPGPVFVGMSSEFRRTVLKFDIPSATLVVEVDEDEVYELIDDFPGEMEEIQSASDYLYANFSDLYLNLLSHNCLYKINGSEYDNLKTSMSFEDWKTEHSAKQEHYKQVLRKEFSNFFDSILCDFNKFYRLKNNCAVNSRSSGNLEDKSSQRASLTTEKSQTIVDEYIDQSGNEERTFFVQFSQTELFNAYIAELEAQSSVKRVINSGKHDFYDSLCIELPIYFGKRSTNFYDDFMRGLIHKYASNKTEDNERLLVNSLKILSTNLAAVCVEEGQKKISQEMMNYLSSVKKNVGSQSAFKYITELVNTFKSSEEEDGSSCLPDIVTVCNRLTNHEIKTFEEFYWFLSCNFLGSDISIHRLLYLIFQAHSDEEDDTIDSGILLNYCENWIESFTKVLNDTAIKSHFPKTNAGNLKGEVVLRMANKIRVDPMAVGILMLTQYRVVLVPNSNFQEMHSFYWKQVEKITMVNNDGIKMHLDDGEKKSEAMFWLRDLCKEWFDMVDILLKIYNHSEVTLDKTLQENFPVEIVLTFQALKSTLVDSSTRISFVGEKIPELEDLLRGTLDTDHLSVRYNPKAALAKHCMTTSRQLLNPCEQVNQHLQFLDEGCVDAFVELREKGQLWVLYTVQMQMGDLEHHSRYPSSWMVRVWPETRGKMLVNALPAVSNDAVFVESREQVLVSSVDGQVYMLDVVDENMVMCDSLELPLPTSAATADTSKRSSITMRSSVSDYYVISLLVVQIEDEETEVVIALTNDGDLLSYNFEGTAMTHIHKTDQLDIQPSEKARLVGHCCDRHFFAVVSPREVFLCKVVQQDTLLTYVNFSHYLLFHPPAMESDICAFAFVCNGGSPDSGDSSPREQDKMQLLVAMEKCPQLIVIGVTLVTCVPRCSTWNVQHKIPVLPTHRNDSVSYLAFHHESGDLVVCTRGGFVYQLTQQSLQSKQDSSNTSDDVIDDEASHQKTICTRSKQGHFDAITRCLFSANSGELITGSRGIDGRIAVWRQSK